MSLAQLLKYANTHEWILMNADGIAEVGITEYAQQSLGDIVFFQLPSEGQTVMAGEKIAVVESVKTASDIHAPVSGKVLSINQEAKENPARVNEYPYQTWLLKLEVIPSSLETDLTKLLSEEEYQYFIKGL